MQKKVKMALKPLITVLTLFVTLLFVFTFVINSTLPDNFLVGEDRELTVNSPVKITAETVYNSEPAGSLQNTESSYPSKLKMLGVFPLKTVQVRVAQKLEVIPLGENFGIKIYTNGVIVTDIQPVDTSSGSKSPGKEAGLQVGDNIVEINGVLPTNADHAAMLIRESHGETISFKVVRDGKTLTLKLTPRLSVSENCYKAGIWIRDSSAGIGTLTFYSPALDVVAGLGHGICDVDTNELLPISAGEMVRSEIFSFVKSRNGSPGELKGRFTGGSIGEILSNNEAGVYAVPRCSFDAQNTVEIALKQEIKVGKATMLTTIDKGGVKEYECYIEKISLKDGEETKNMIVRITDKELLSQTGGILQGMSGSPLFQDGKLIGAITHVLVNDTTCGYAIFAENMLENARCVAEQKLKEAS